MLQKQAELRNMEGEWKIFKKALMIFAHNVCEVKKKLSDKGIRKEVNSGTDSLRVR